MKLNSVDAFIISHVLKHRNLSSLNLSVYLWFVAVF